MADFIDWNKLCEVRRQLAGEPNDETLRTTMAMWRDRLAPGSTFSEEALDGELVKLLEKIHHAF